VARFEERTGLAISLELGNDLDAVCSSEALPPAAGVQLLRILQEALANVRKHAGSPSQIDVRLVADDGQLQMAIVDNGAGFDPALAGPEGQHFGLQVMRQRTERIGGQLATQSAPGQGARVEVCVPLDGNTRGTVWRSCWQTTMAFSWRACRTCSELAGTRWLAPPTMAWRPSS
jgi:signal transduction histidine kinase